MISEGSCDTKYWSYAAENSALPSQEQVTFWKSIKRKNWYLKFLDFIILPFYFVFDQINAALMSKSGLFKNLKNPYRSKNI